MIKTKKQYAGVSLVELILVLAIGAAILILSLRQYQVFRQDADADQLVANVNTLMQAMGQYYKANCYGTYNPNANPPLTPGTLNPLNTNDPLPGPFPINITTDLVDNGYLSPEMPISSLVDTTGAEGNNFNGYVAQFNASIQMVRNPGSGAVGQVLIWKPQISVLLKDTENATQYLNWLQADCLSSLNGETVSRCQLNSNTGTYLVWERMPSYAASKGNSSLWEAKAVSTQFNQMYTTYPTVYLLNTGGKVPTTGSATQTQYYLCGG